MKRQKPKRAVEPQRKLPRWPFKEREPERRLDAFRNLHPLILRKKLKTMAQLFHDLPDMRQHEIDSEISEKTHELEDFLSETQVKPQVIKQFGPQLLFEAEILFQQAQEYYHSPSPNPLPKIPKPRKK